MGWRMNLVAPSASALVAVLWLAACANQAPVALSSQFSPPQSQEWLESSSTGNSKSACRVRIAEVHDLRSDPRSMGLSGGRLVHSADTTAWIRSGFLSLGADRRLQMTEDAAPGDLTIDVDVLKAYAMNVTGETRAASVVLRVRYSRDGTPAGEQIYRGTQNGLNWSSGEGETQSSFDAALADLLKTVDSELVARCAERRAH